MLRALKERQPAEVDVTIKLVAPDYVAPDPAERSMVERILQAFVHAKREQTSGDSRLLPSGGWKTVLEQAYEPLIRGGRNQDLETFHYYLANFGAWHEPTGITESYLLRGIGASRQRQKHFENRVMADMIAWWQLFEAHGRELDALRFPRFGNQSGVSVGSHFLSTDSVPSDVDARVIAGLVSDQCPLLAELGGGFGRLITFVSRWLTNFRYLGFDLPECLACASYYLMQVFPDKRFLLYGEADWTRLDWADYDFVLLPSYELSKLPASTVDLFLNENSLGVMTPEACRYFVGEICRTARGFWHRNHEVRTNRFPDGIKSLVNREYPIPADRFVQRARYCDVRRFIGADGATLDNDMYWHYYEATDK